MGAFKSIYTDYACEPSQTLVSPKLTLEANSAGSLEFSVMQGQDGYNNTYTAPRNGYLVVLKDGEPIWDGRVTTRDMDWNNTKSIYAEGALSYLNDIMIQSLEDTSDFKTARSNAQTDLKKKESAYNKAKKEWEDGGSPSSGTLYNKYKTAKKNLACSKKNYANCVYNANIVDPTDDELLLELIEDDYYGENGPKIFEMMLEKYNAQAENSSVHNQFVLGDVFVPAVHEAYEAVDEDDYLIEWDSPDFTTVHEYFSSMLEKIPNTYLSVTYEYNEKNLLVRKLNWLLQGVNKDNIEAVKQYYNTNVKSAKTAYNTAAKAYNKWYVKAYDSAKDAEDIDALIKSNADYTAKHNPLVTATNNLKTVNAKWNTYIKSLVDYSSPDIVVKQTVNFGENLLDFKRNIDSTEMFTRLIPIGEDDLYLNDDKSSNAIYVQDNELVAQYGVITRKMNFDKIRDVKTLKQQAKAELAKMKARIDGSKESIEITALDLRYLDSNAYYGKSLNIFDVVDCISAPHGFVTSNKFPVLKEEIDMAQPENTKFTLNAIVEYQSVTSQLASTSASAMATASTVSTLGDRQNNNITYSSVRVNQIVTSGTELARINDVSIYSNTSNRVYISELAPTVEDNAIGGEGDLWYKVKRRGHFEGAVLKCIRAGRMTHPDMEFSVGQYVRVNYGNYWNSDHPYLKEWGPTNWSGWIEYNFISLSNMEGINEELSIWGNFPGYYPWLYGNQSLRLWTCNYDEERMITSNESAAGGFGRTAVGYSIGYQGKNHGWSTLNIGGILNNIEYNAEESDEYMVNPSVVKSTIDGLALFEIVDWGEGTNYGYDGTIIERMTLERYVKYDGVWVTADYKAGKGIIIADGEIRINTSTSVDIVQNVTSGTQLATINDKPIYAPTVSATQTQTSGTEIAQINVGDASTPIYAPTTTVTQTLTEGTEIGEVNGTKLYAPSGGGSDVTVTPKTSTGTNIADIEVDGTTYQLFAPSGGGGGSGSGYTETSLWSGSQTTTGTITLSDSIQNYDIIVLRWSPHHLSTDYYQRTDMILVSSIMLGSTYQYLISEMIVAGEYSSFASCHFEDYTHFVLDEITSGNVFTFTFLEVIGLKFGGSNGHNYSTTEQVVGTWIDGSTLYEKTYTYSFTASSSDYEYNIATLSSEINPQSIETNAFHRNGILFKEVIYPPGDIYCRYAINNNVLSVRAFNSSGCTFDGTVTIRYTKTS